MRRLPVSHEAFAIYLGLSKGRVYQVRTNRVIGFLFLPGEFEKLKKSAWHGQVSGGKVTLPPLRSAWCKWARVVW